MSFVDTIYIDAVNILHFLSAQDLENASIYKLPLPDPSWTVATPAQISAVQAALVSASNAEIASLINPIAFSNSVKATFGGIVAASALGALPLYFFAALQLQNWTDVQDIIIHANTAAIITNAQYAEIKAAASTYNIPIQL